MEKSEESRKKNKTDKIKELVGKNLEISFKNPLKSYKEEIIQKGEQNE